MDIELFMENGVALSRLFQENFLNLHSLMQFVNYLTEPEVILLVYLAIYWGINREQGSRYLYLWALVISIFSILQHIIQFPAPFWFDSTVLFEETGSFSAPNLNVALSLLLVLPFIRYIRADLIIIVFLGMALLGGLSQVYLAIASVFDVVFGFVFGGVLIGIWQFWNKRFGKSFAQRILGQRFWLAVLFPCLLVGGYLLLINWVQRTGYTGLTEVDPKFYWRAWQMGIINSITCLSFLLGIGTGITIEKSRNGFQPVGHIVGSLLGWVIGYLLLGGSIYLIRFFIPVSAAYLSGRSLDYVFLAFKGFAIALVCVYFIPRVFTLIGLTETDLSDTPEISLNKFA